MIFQGKRQWGIGPTSNRIVPKRLVGNSPYGSPISPPAPVGIYFTSEGDSVRPVVNLNKEGVACVWHWSDGSTTAFNNASSNPVKTGLGAGSHQHYLECPEMNTITRFGGVAGYLSGITNIGDLNLLVNLSILLLYENGDCLSVGRIDKCTKLGQFHLAGSGLTNECLDQIFADMVVANATPSAWYAPNVNNGTVASHADRAILISRGWSINPDP